MNSGSGGMLGVEGGRSALCMGGAQLSAPLRCLLRLQGLFWQDFPRKDAQSPQVSWQAVGWER